MVARPESERLHRKWAPVVTSLCDTLISHVVARLGLISLWLVTPALSLGGVTPLSRLHSDEGLQEVLRVLASIEHGLPP